MLETRATGGQCNRPPPPTSTKGILTWSFRPQIYVLHLPSSRFLKVFFQPKQNIFWFFPLSNQCSYGEIKCQLDATDGFFIADLIACSTCFGTPLCPSSGAQEYYTGGCCLWYLVLWFSSCRSGVELWVVCPVCGMLQVWCRAVGCVSGLLDVAGLV